MSTTIATFRKPVRALLGDRDAAVFLYSNTAIDDAVEVAVRMGKLTDHTVTEDGLSITPAVTSPNAYALLACEVALMFVASNPDRYSFKTRPLAESFGSWKDFTHQLELSIHDLRAGTMFDSWQNLHAWLLGITGLPYDTALSEVTVDAPLTTLSVG